MSKGTNLVFIDALYWKKGRTPSGFSIKYDFSWLMQPGFKWRVVKRLHSICRLTPTNSRFSNGLSLPLENQNKVKAKPDCKVDRFFYQFQPKFMAIRCSILFRVPTWRYPTAQRKVSTNTIRYISIYLAGWRSLLQSACKEELTLLVPTFLKLSNVSSCNI